MSEEKVLTIPEGHRCFNVIDADTIMYRNAAVCQNNIIARHIETGREKAFSSRKKLREFIAVAADEEKQKHIALEGEFWIPEFFEEIGKEFSEEEFEVRDEATLKETLDGSHIRNRCFYNIKREIERQANLPWVLDYKVLIGGEGNFRYDVGTILPYKGKRPPKPLLFLEAKEYMIKQFAGKIELANDEEADDLCGIYATQGFNGTKENSFTVISGIDKDLHQFEGWHYNYDRDTFKWIDAQEARHNFWIQMLMGDSSDNIPGVKKLPDHLFDTYGVKKRKGGAVGAVTAERILEGLKGEEAMKARVVECFREQYPENWKEVLLENYRLLHLRRYKEQMISLEDILGDEA